MRKYEKIETVYARDTQGTKKLIPGEFRDETVHSLALIRWIWTEKVDGTNIRIYWDGHKISFGGRTDSAMIPGPLMNRLNELFGGTVNEEVFEQIFGEKEVILFGEGYGNKIQKVGKDYLPDSVNFILFDVLIGDNYQPRETVERIAAAFNVPVVPIVGYGTLYDAVSYVEANPKSIVAQERCNMEGIVCRPEMELRDRCGNRIIVKIKWEDFKTI